MTAANHSRVARTTLVLVGLWLSIPSAQAAPTSSAEPIEHSVKPEPSAASASEPEQRAERNPWLGGFGFFSPGLVVGNFGDMGRALEDGSALGPGGAPSDVAVTVGGGGGQLLGGVFMLRGKGFGLFAPTATTRRGRAALTGIGGGADVGLVLFNRRRWLLYPYVGVGGVSSSSSVRNDHDDDIIVAGRTLSPGQELDLKSGYFTFELGFAFQRLMFRKPRHNETSLGGFINGGEVGAIVSLGRSTWQSEGNSVPDMPSTQLLGGYVRLLIGGGGFGRWSPPKWKRRRDRAPATK